MVCKGNESLTVTGKTLSLAGAVPVLALGNCTIHLVACTVSGASAVMAKGNSTVVVEGGTLTGTGPAVVLAENAGIQTSNGARISGEPAITLTNNAQATLQDSAITGSVLPFTRRATPAPMPPDPRSSGRSSGASGTEPVDILEPDPEALEQLVRARMPFGKYRGLRLVALPEAYLVGSLSAGFRAASSASSSGPSTR